tara:strand:+ start:5307 stop:5603 length:297 start_codon:yes stop_codon:yes gene_type:complete
MSNLTRTGLGSDTLAVSSTSIGLASVANIGIPNGAARATIFVTGAAIHMENDGSDATTSSQLVRAEGRIHLEDGRYKLNQFRFIRNAADATLYVSYSD